MSDFPQDISLDEAYALISPLMRDIGAQSQSQVEVPLSDAANRIIATDITSTIDVPAQDCAAVDGYAFYFEDLEKPLPIVGSIKAGHPFTQKAEKGFAYRIFTGAPMPEGPDTIAMQENCEIDQEGSVILPQNLKLKSNYRPRGENVSKGEIILKKGTMVGPAEIGLAAAVGLSTLPVKPILKVALISIGDEIAEVGSRSGSETGKIFDSNRPMLKAMMKSIGHQVVDFGIVKDNLEELIKTFLEAKNKADVILISGGSSEGDEDHTKSAIINSGGIIDFWRLALKPGRPMVSGRIGKTPIFGLPGNPVAAFVCTRLIAEPMMSVLQGQLEQYPIKLEVCSGFEKTSRKGRAEYIRARLENGAKGLHAVINGKPGAGVLSSLTGADGLVEIPAECDRVKEGDTLSFLIFREAGL